MSRLFRVTMWVLLALGIPMAALTLGIGLVTAPMSLPLSAVFVPLYGALWIYLLRLSRGWPSAGPWWVLASLGAGVGVAGGAILLAVPFMDLPQQLGLDVFEASFGGAYPEELLKTCAVCVVLLSFARLDRPWHGIFTGGLVGLGFELAENAIYAATGALFDPDSDAAGALSMWFLRIVAGPGLHVMFSGIAGWGIGQLLFRADLPRARRWAAGLGWLGVGFLLHFTWNILPQHNDWLQAITMGLAGLVGYPLFIWLLVRAHRWGKADRAARPEWYRRPARRGPRRAPRPVDSSGSDAPSGPVAPSGVAGPSGPVPQPGSVGATGAAGPAVPVAQPEAAAPGRHRSTGWGTSTPDRSGRPGRSTGWGGAEPR